MSVGMWMFELGIVGIKQGSAQAEGRPHVSIRLGHPQMVEPTVLQ